MSNEVQVYEGQGVKPIVQPKQLPNKRTQVVNGTAYHQDTPQAVVNILERYRQFAQQSSRGPHMRLKISAELRLHRHLENSPVGSA